MGKTIFIVLGILLFCAGAACIGFNYIYYHPTGIAMDHGIRVSVYSNISAHSMRYGSGKPYLVSTELTMVGEVLFATDTFSVTYTNERGSTTENRSWEEKPRPATPDELIIWNSHPH